MGGEGEGGGCMIDFQFVLPEWLLLAVTKYIYFSHKLLRSWLDLSTVTLVWF